MHAKWKLKVLVQYVFAHVPGGEWLNHRLQRRSGSHSRQRSEMHVADVLNFLADIREHLDLRDKRVLEIGTGWDGIHALTMSVLGARRIVTFDHVRHLRFDLAMQGLEALHVHPLMSSLLASDSDAAMRLDDLQRSTSVNDLLDRARVTYAAPGDATKSGLAPSSVDVVYSFAVLEHVSEKVIMAALAEAKRVLAPGGVFVAVIGTGDHYTSVDATLTSVNFLRYPEWLWAPLVKNKVSYHNRLRERDFLDMFCQVGARILWKRSHVEEGDIAAVESMHIDRRFAGMTPEELAVSRCDIVLAFG